MSATITQQGFLRFITCGSVDDGKSTLIGRILFDSGSLHEDRLQNVKNESAKYGTTGVQPDLALLVDGLQSEREQGITIDVAHLYFSTHKKKYIIADTPGHEQYTANMATGASTADAAVILIDARKGVLTQTKRHSYIAYLLGIKHLIVAVNKMDLVDFSQEVFEKISADYDREVASVLGISGHTFVPVSALGGDNVFNKSANTPWYRGDSIMRILDAIDEAESNENEKFRLAVQYVNRPNLDFRGFCGQIASGSVSIGDHIEILPSRKKTTVKQIFDADGESQKASSGNAVTITTADEVDIGRGDLIVHEDDALSVADTFAADLIWFDDGCEGESGKNYALKMGTKTVQATLQSVIHTIDPNTFEKKSGISKLALNDIASCRIVLHEKTAFDTYNNCKTLGSFVLIDRTTNKTAAAGMIRRVAEEDGTSQQGGSAFEKELNAFVRKHFPHWGCKEIV